MTLAKELRTKTILLLDPDPWTRDALSLLLGWTTGRFASCDNVEDGHRAIDAEPFDVVICAYGTPGMDALKFLDHCRECHPGAVRILVGSHNPPQFADVPPDSPVDAWLQKPLTLESVEAALRQALSGSPAGPGS
ncbi:MAG TPA: hypothetical protein VIU29_02440 [Candidatus Deferrimicrobiaceae bacterium]